MAGGTRVAFLNPSPIFACTPLWNTPSLPHPPLPPYSPPSPLSPSSPPPPAGPSLGSLPTLTQCTVTAGGVTRQFTACNALPGNFLFLWTLHGSTVTAAFVARGVKRGGYMAVGLSPAGTVADSSVLVAVFPALGNPGGNSGDENQSGDAPASAGASQGTSAVVWQNAAAVSRLEGSPPAGGGSSYDTGESGTPGGSSSGSSSSSADKPAGDERVVVNQFLITSASSSSPPAPPSDGSATQSNDTSQSLSTQQGGALAVLSALAYAQPSTAGSNGDDGGTLVMFFSLLLLPNQTAASYLVWTRGSYATSDELSEDGLDAMYTSAIGFERGSDVGQGGSNKMQQMWMVRMGVCAPNAS